MEILPEGKLPPAQLSRLVLGQLSPRRPEVVIRPAIGEDAAALRFGDELCVVTSDPITGATYDLGWLGVHVCCNDLGAMGAEPVALQVVLLLPVGTSEDWLRSVMARMEAACAALNVEITGGHTEVTDRVREPVFIGTALGRVRPGRRLVSSHGAQPGDALLVTKALGLEGTAILAAEARDDLSRRLAPEKLAAILQEAEGYRQEISVVKEGLLAAEAGATAMHDVTEGGLYVALRELAAGSGLAFRVHAEALPVRYATRVICAALGLDPLGLISSGALLIAHPRPLELKERLAEAGIPASVIGELVAAGPESGLAPGEGVLITAGGTAGESAGGAPGSVPWPVREEDELWRYWAQRRTP
ncbi:MAG: AIR synthase family protein [Limnochordales bacterium]|nr:AIR synthase family protein [Limnochordales bacterium]